MSLLSKVKKRLQEQREKTKEEKAQRSIIEHEAKERANKAYLESYKQQRISKLVGEAKTRAKREASGESRFSLGGIGTGLSKAGTNFLGSDQFDLGFGTGKKSSAGMFDLGFGTTTPKHTVHHKAKGKHGKGTTITVDGTTIHIGHKGTGHKKPKHKQTKSKEFNPWTM